jgi:hypothetical protein
VHVIQVLEVELIICFVDELHDKQFENEQVMQLMSKVVHEMQVELSKLRTCNSVALHELHFVLLQVRHCRW